jgi:hypothetical protein
MGWFNFTGRALEATPEQVIATGAMAGTYGRDPIDGDVGYRPAGSAGRAVPYWTQERARTNSVASYRMNPMCASIVDTYTAFCVGDSGVKLQCTNDAVRVVADEFWTDPANRLPLDQEINLRSQILMGETVLGLAAGPVSGAVRFGPVDPINIADVLLRHGNPMWPQALLLRPAPGEMHYRQWPVVQVNDETGLREGRAMFWTPWKTINTDVRSMPYLTSILDWLDNYDMILSNMMDRTALARYLTFDVTIKGGKQPDVDAFVAARGGTHLPPSGSMEVHTDAVEIKPMNASTGAYEDTRASQTVLTSIAAGAGLAKTWLAEPEDANRATALTMAEPVRRRVGGVQKVWLQYQTELVRFAVDQAVAARRIPRMVESTDPRTGQRTMVPASQTVMVTGPEVAAADAQLTAQVLLNLSTGLEKLVTIKALTPEAAAMAARKGWEDYVGVPYEASLGQPGANPDDVATHVDDTTRAGEGRLGKVIQLLPGG